MNTRKSFSEAALSITLGTISMAISSYIALNMLDLVSPLLRREVFSGRASVLIALGYFLLIVVSMAWIGSLMLVYRYYYWIQNDSLIARFLRVTAVEFVVFGGLDLLRSVLLFAQNSLRTATVHGLMGACVTGAGAALFFLARTVKQRHYERSEREKRG